MDDTDYHWYNIKNTLIMYIDNSIKHITYRKSGKVKQRSKCVNT